MVHRVGRSTGVWVRNARFDALPADDALDRLGSSPAVDDFQERRSAYRRRTLQSGLSGFGPSGSYDECPLLGLAVPERIVAIPPFAEVPLRVLAMPRHGASLIRLKGRGSWDRALTFPDGRDPLRWARPAFALTFAALLKILVEFGFKLIHNSNEPTIICGSME
jgi:hypothetical protein